jgi:hypothetical protein
LALPEKWWEMPTLQLFNNPFKETIFLHHLQIGQTKIKYGSEKVNFSKKA